MDRPSEHRYSVEERRRQLAELVAALPELINVASATPEAASLVPQYARAFEEANCLFQTGFSQEQLSLLSRAVPDVFFRHKEWSPPLEQISGGGWCEPQWFIRLESKLQPVLKAAAILRVIGYY